MVRKHWHRTETQQGRQSRESQDRRFHDHRGFDPISGLGGFSSERRGDVRHEFG
jgi:hypothetical protein